MNMKKMCLVVNKATGARLGPYELWSAAGCRAVVRMRGHKLDNWNDVPVDILTDLLGMEIQEIPVVNAKRPRLLAWIYKSTQGNISPKIRFFPEGATHNCSNEPLTEPLYERAPWLDEPEEKPVVDMKRGEADLRPGKYL